MISIGIVCEDGREFYAINRNLNVRKAWKDPWIREHVLLQIWNEFASGFLKNVFHFTLSTMKWIFKTHGESIKNLNVYIREFIYHPALEYEGMDGLDKAVEYYIAAGNTIDFYSYYADYDFVVFCWIFGRMIDLPEGFPMYCIDLKQILDEKELDSAWTQKCCPKPEGEHSAIVDAKWHYELFLQINRRGK